MSEGQKLRLKEILAEFAYVVYEKSYLDSKDADRAFAAIVDCLEPVSPPPHGQAE